MGMMIAVPAWEGAVRVNTTHKHTGQCLAHGMGHMECWKLLVHQLRRVDPEDHIIFVLSILEGAPLDDLGLSSHIIQ